MVEVVMVVVCWGGEGSVGLKRDRSGVREGLVGFGRDWWVWKGIGGAVD